MLATLSSLTSVRNTYIAAIESSSKANELVRITSLHNNQATYRAYYATGLALQAKHSWSPATKLSKASEASKELNAAVSADKENFEVRFLRFSFEANAPGFLGLSQHIREDKKWLLSHLNKSHPIWSTIRSFLKDSDLLTEAEKKNL